MSRIDTAQLLLQITPKAAYGSKIRVYATNYNVYNKKIFARKSITPHVYGFYMWKNVLSPITHFYHVLHSDASNSIKHYCNTFQFRETAKANSTKVLLKNNTGHDLKHGYSKNELDVKQHFIVSKCAIRRKFSNLFSMKTLQRVYICGVLFYKNLKMYSSPLLNMSKDRVVAYVLCRA
jgi:hypothetical protein